MMLRSTILLAVTLVAASCWVPIEKGQAMEADLVKIKGEMAEQRRLFDESEARAERERERLRTEQEAALKRVDVKIEQLNKAARKTGADLGVEVEETRAEIARLRGLFEEVKAKQDGGDGDTAKKAADHETRLVALETKLGAIDAAKKAADAAETARIDAEKKKLAERIATKDGYYGYAKETLDAGKNEEARGLFADFLTKWKSDPLAANAQYWIGESLYAEKKYREAVFEFRKVGEQWPKSEKAPDALLKMGFAFYELGLGDEGKLFLEEVVRTHPKSNAAKLAKSKLGTK